jgi:hypothetical protein
MIKLGQALDGRLVLGSNQPFPADVKYVEYYREPRLFNLVFDTTEEESHLMPQEIDEKTASIVTTSPNIIIIAMAEIGANPYGYAVPLVQVGV